MLEGGADIRKLQEVHARCHPAAKGGAGDPPAASGDSPGAPVTPEKPLPPGAPIELSNPPA